MQNINLTREEAERRLKDTFGLERFYDEQWQVIERLLRGERCLLIQRTGFGKSLCYQFPATLFDGLTIIFSPLIALMRDQVRTLTAKGIAADYINSERTKEENEQTIQKAISGGLKILYIAPERQENRYWQEAVQRMRLSMVVVDEAHTISVWGHDFRPAFRRIVDVVARQPQSMPILATTATATLRTQEDIETQLGNNLLSLRGDLCRENLYLWVVRTQSEEEKMLCIAHYMSKLQGTELIYTGTRADTEKYAGWLTHYGVQAVAYNAGMDEQSRRETEQGLMENRWKCVVSTNALGMVIDKSDIRFIIHTQIPQSPIHYYQEIGRAGRDGKKACIILFFNENEEDGVKADMSLPLAFVNQARPAKETYQTIIDLLKKEPLTERQIIKAANLKTTQVRVIKADLLDQKIVREVMYGRQKVYEYQYDAPDLDYSRFETLRQAKMRELEAMVQYVYTTEPRMKYLCSFLDSVYPDKVYAHCDNTDQPKLPIPKSEKLREQLTNYLENLFPVLETEVEKYHVCQGVAASYYGVSNVGRMIHRSKYENGGDFPPYLVGLTLRAFRKHYGQKKFDYIVFVPPTVSGRLVENFAVAVSELTHIPLLHAIRKTRDTQEQKSFLNKYNKTENLDGAFEVTEDIRDKTLLLIDDIFDSGATIQETAKVLAAAGAKEICPLVIAKTVGSDNI